MAEEETTFDISAQVPAPVNQPVGSVLKSSGQADSNKANTETFAETDPSAPPTNSPRISGANPNLAVNTDSSGETSLVSTAPTESAPALLSHGETISAAELEGHAAAPEDILPISGGEAVREAGVVPSAEIPAAMASPTPTELVAAPTSAVIADPENVQKKKTPVEETTALAIADGFTGPFQTALASRFDKVPSVWGKEALPLTMDNLQARLRERLQLAELQRSKAEHSKDASASSDDKADKKNKPERENKYRPQIQIYRNKPAISHEELTEKIWGSYEQRTIVSAAIIPKR